MKFVIAFTTLLAAAVMGAPRHKLDSRFADLQKKYNAIAPKLMKLVPKGAGSGLALNVGSLGSLAGLGSSSQAYMEIDIDALKSAGYDDLARAIEKSADFSLDAGEMGLKALEALTNGDLETAQQYGDKASSKGMDALAALPASSDINSKAIDDLKRQGMHRVADSLANVKRTLDSADFTLNMMSGFTDMATSFDNTGKFAKKGQAGTAAIKNAFASKPHSTHKQNAYSTYQNNYPQQTYPAWQRQNAGRNVYQQQWGPSRFFNNWQQPLNNNWQPGQGYSFFQYY